MWLNQISNMPRRQTQAFPRLLPHLAMPGPEPELHGFARMVGNGVGLPSWTGVGLEILLPTI